MTEITVAPGQQIQNLKDSLLVTEYRLEQAGINTSDLRQWLNQVMLLHDLEAKHGRGELEPLVIAEEDYY